MKITAKSPKDGKALDIEVDVPGSLHGLVEKYGEEVVYDLARSRLVVNIQNVMRVGLKDGDAEEKIRETVANYVPGVRAPRESKSAFERILESVQGGKLSAEELAALQKALKSPK